MTHDYKRNGTTTLFAALDLVQGRVIGDFHKRHRHQEYLKFLRRIDKEFSDKTLHLVIDNYGSHGHADVQVWLKKHPRFVIHYVPTVADLQAATEEFLAVWNDNPKPFVWTATVESIVGKLARCRQTLEQIQPGCTLPNSRKHRSS